jgi:glycosyltransferase involved in cell wall biosynthesis
LGGIRGTIPLSDHFPRADVSSLSIVIRSFNEEEHIGSLLAGIGHQTLQPAQIVLVDSGSTDRTVEIAQRFGAEVLRIEPESFSFGRSLNFGCAAATGEVIVIASAHVRPVFDTWLEMLTAPLADEQVALAYGRQQGDHRTRFSEAQILSRWFPDRSDPRQDHPFCNNANAAIRRESWLSQPYDEQLTGLEDLEWARLVIEKGQRIAYVAEAPVIHVHEESWLQVANRYRREAIAHRRIFHDHRIGMVNAFRLGFANIVSDYYHAIREGVLLTNLGSIPAFRAAQFWGTYHGFAQQGSVSAAVRRRFYYPRGFNASQQQPPPPETGSPIVYEERPES